MTVAEYFARNVYDRRLALSTVNSMRSTLSFVRRYDIELDKVDFAWLQEIDKRLASTGKAPTTINKMHAHIKKILNLALKEGLIEKNPYMNMVLHATKSTRTFLTKDEALKIFKHECYFSDVFEFQTLTGLNIGDLLSLRREHIVSLVVDGQTYHAIDRSRQKTDTHYVVPLKKRAVEIGEKYDYQFNINTRDYNAWLKDISNKEGITKHVTNAVGRHTYATQLLEDGVSLEAVSGSLGHTSTKTTQIYAEITGAKIVRDFVKNGLM
jgi:site-specific recombinase XerD